MFDKYTWQNSMVYNTTSETKPLKVEGEAVVEIKKQQIYLNDTIKWFAENQKVIRNPQ